MVTMNGPPVMASFGINDMTSAVTADDEAMLGFYGRDRIADGKVIAGKMLVRNQHLDI